VARGGFSEAVSDLDLALILSEEDDSYHGIQEAVSDFKNSCAKNGSRCDNYYFVDRLSVFCAPPSILQQLPDHATLVRPASARAPMTTRKYRFPMHDRADLRLHGSPILLDGGSLKAGATEAIVHGHAPPACGVGIGSQREPFQLEQVAMPGSVFRFQFHYYLVSCLGSEPPSRSFFCGHVGRDD
jgi:hypothetical protein